MTKAQLEEAEELFARLEKALEDDCWDAGKNDVASFRAMEAIWPELKRLAQDSESEQRMKLVIPSDEARDKALEAAVLGSGLGSTAALLAGNEGKYERMCCKVSGVYDGDRNGATLLCTDADKIIADRAVALVFGEKKALAAAESEAGNG